MMPLFSGVVGRKKNGPRHRKTGPPFQFASVTDAIFCKTETWTHLPSRDVWKIATSWVRIPNACLVIEGASPISEILFDSGLHIGLHENTGRNCWCSSSIGGMESLPFSAWDWVAEHPRMQPNTIFDLTTIQLDYTDAPLRDSKCLWLRKLQWVAESTSQIASNPYWIVVFLSLALHDGCST